MDISVIIPTCFRSLEAIEKNLKSLSEQTFSKDCFEVLFVDDGSDRQHQAHIENVLSQYFPHYAYLWQEKAGQGPARNLAIKQAKGHILLILNDDAISIPSLLQDHFDKHQEHDKEGDVILGKFTVSPELPYSMFAKMHSDLSYGPFEGKLKLTWRAFYTCNISVKKSFLDNYGVFDPDLRYYEDVELGERLSHHGLQIYYYPEILAYHYHYLGEKHFLGYAPFHSKVLVDWYKKAPHLADELVAYGFYPADKNRHRFKELVWDCLVNRVTIPVWLVFARALASSQEELSLKMYKKVFIAMSRRTIKYELRKSSS